MRFKGTPKRFLEIQIFKTTGLRLKLVFSEYSMNNFDNMWVSIFLVLHPRQFLDKNSKNSVKNLMKKFLRCELKFSLIVSVHRLIRWRMT